MITTKVGSNQSNIDMEWYLIYHFTIQIQLMDWYLRETYAERCLFLFTADSYNMMLHGAWSSTK